MKKKIKEKMRKINTGYMKKLLIRGESSIMLKTIFIT